MIRFSYTSEPVLIASGKYSMAGVLELPRSPGGIVLVPDAGGAHGGFLAAQLRRAGLGQLSIGLRASGRSDVDPTGPGVDILFARLAAAADWLAAEPETTHLALGLHGSGEGSAAALQLAASRPAQVAAVVICGGRPDLAGAEALLRVRTPTLLIIGEQDGPLIEHNRRALEQLRCEKELAVLRGATCASESPRTLDQTARLATRWFKGYFGGSARPAAEPMT